jgi:RNA polymerase sigma-70 factor (ECF subfamily)
MMCAQDKVSVWFRRWKSGDYTAFENLIRHFEPRLMSYLRHLAFSQDDAEDLFQETFLKMIQNRERIPENTHFDFYLLRTARNLAISGFRRKKVARREIERRGHEVLLRYQGADDTSEWRETHERIHQAIGKLEKEEREVVALKIWNEQSWESIGKLMGFSADTAARRFSRALKHLYRELEPLLGVS